MGRRRPVAETIDRRFPSARERPGAGSLPVLAPGRLRGWQRSLGGSTMSLWRRAPRQVYRVYAEDEYLAEEHGAAESERLREAEQPGSRERRPEIGLSPPTGSRTARLVGVGLLLGATVGAAGLVLSHLTHEASPPRGSSSGSLAARRPSPTSSRSFSHRTSGEASADPQSESQSSGTSRIRASVSGYAPPGFAADRRASASAAAAREPVESRRSASARTAGPNWSARAAASATSQAPVSSAVAGGEFEFER